MNLALIRWEKGRFIRIADFADGGEEKFNAEAGRARREDGFSRKKARKYAKRRVGRVWGGREALRITKCRFGASKRDLP